MRLSLRFTLTLLAIVPVLTTVGCNSVPNQWHRQSALVNRRLHGQNQQLAQTQTAIDQDRQRLAQENADLQQRLAAANARLDNLNSERAQLQSRYTNLMKNQQSGALPESTARKLKDLASRYPDFKFDEETGISQMGTDFLFASGSTQLSAEGSKLIAQLGHLLNDGEQRHLKVQIVGHTDDRKIAKAETKKVHPTNWHLSTNRANEVLLSMSKAGVDPKRMSSAGFGEYRPAAPNSTDAGRKANRRVEIYVFAPDSPIAQIFDELGGGPQSATNSTDEFSRAVK